MRRLTRVGPEYNPGRSNPGSPNCTCSRVIGSNRPAWSIGRVDRYVAGAFTGRSLKGGETPTATRARARALQRSLGWTRQGSRAVTSDIEPLTGKRMEQPPVTKTNRSPGLARFGLKLEVRCGKDGSEIGKASLFGRAQNQAFLPPSSRISYAQRSRPYVLP